MAAEALAEPGVEGVTISGGEPLEQPEPLREFCALIRPSGLGIIVLSGFSRAEIEANLTPLPDPRAGWATTGR